MKSINDQIRELQLIKKQIRELQLIKKQIRELQLIKEQVEEGPQIALITPSIETLDKAIAKAKAHAEAKALYVHRLYTSFTK